MRRGLLDVLMYQKSSRCDLNKSENETVLLPDKNTGHRRGKHRTNTYEARRMQSEACSHFPSD